MKSDSNKETRSLMMGDLKVILAKAGIFLTTDIIPGKKGPRLHGDAENAAGNGQYRANKSNNQRGAALITVLFIFMIASLIVFSMLSRQRLDVERTATVIAQAQGYAYLGGAEDMARQVLISDAAQMPGIDYPGQRWAHIRTDFPVENGSLAMHLEDLQGRFNINTLIETDAAKERFLRLTRSLHVRDEAAHALILALGDKNAPVPFSDITQIKTVSAVLPEEASILMPYISALPERESALNVNTASEIVLKAYIPNDAAYGNIAKALLDKGYLNLGQLNAIGMNTKGMNVESHYFYLSSLAVINGRTLLLGSIITRYSDLSGAIHAEVISRSMGGAF